MAKNKHIKEDDLNIVKGHIRSMLDDIREQFKDAHLLFYSEFGNFEHHDAESDFWDLPEDFIYFYIELSINSYFDTKKIDIELVMQYVNGIVGKGIAFKSEEELRQWLYSDKSESEIIALALELVEKLCETE